jgi:hypothetical protein
MALRDALSALGVRFERSAAGEALISVLVCVVMLIAVAWNLPDSYLKRSLVEVLRPVAESTGLQQKWSMYAPDPISVLETLEVRVTFTRGGSRTWNFHRGDPVIGSFTWYHWQKLKEQLIRNRDAVPEFAQWAVRELTAPGDRPEHVEVLVRSEPLRPPGDDRPTDITVRTLYSADLRVP